MDGDGSGEISPGSLGSALSRGQAGNERRAELKLLFVDPAAAGRERFSASLSAYPFIALRVTEHISASSSMPHYPDVIVVQAPHAGAQSSSFSQTIARASTLFPRAAILILNGETEHRQRDMAMLSGVAGFLSRDAQPDSLVAAVLLASRGMSVLPRPALDQLRHAARRGSVALRASRRKPNNAEGAIPLTLRQQQVVQLLLEGLSNKEIARRLGITESTVKVHVRSIMSRAGVMSRTQLVLSVLNRAD